MRPNLTHIALHVRDLEACVEFYEKYVQMRVIHARQAGERRIVWISEEGREQEFIMVLLPGGPGRNQQDKDYSHLGFAVESRTRVDEIAELAAADNILVWEPRDEPFPVGYYCGVRDPDGNFVEFSYGQPLGPGAEQSIIDYESNN